MAGGTPGGVDDRALPPVAALLRRPATLIRHEILAGLREAGYDDILPAHLSVFQYPGPEGQRPGVLAARAHASKQAMNHLLHQLESGGYLVREQQQGDRRTRVVRLTERGRAASAVIQQSVDRIEADWERTLGKETYLDLRRGLSRVARMLDGEDVAG